MFGILAMTKAIWCVENNAVQLANKKKSIKTTTTKCILPQSRLQSFSMLAQHQLWELPGEACHHMEQSPYFHIHQVAMPSAPQQFAWDRTMPALAETQVPGKTSGFLLWMKIRNITAKNNFLQLPRNWSNGCPMTKLNGTTKLWSPYSLGKDQTCPNLKDQIAQNISAKIRFVDVFSSTANRLGGLLAEHEQPEMQTRETICDILNYHLEMIDIGYTGDSTGWSEMTTTLKYLIDNVHLNDSLQNKLLKK